MVNRVVANNSFEKMRGARKIWGLFSQPMERGSHLRMLMMRNPIRCVAERSADIGTIYPMPTLPTAANSSSDISFRPL